MTGKPDEEFLMAVQHIPRGHIIVGYVAHLKVLDENGGVYWAQRSGGVNDMEGLGLAQIMVDSMIRDIRKGQT